MKEEPHVKGWGIISAKNKYSGGNPDEVAAMEPKWQLGDMS